MSVPLYKLFNQQMPAQQQPVLQNGPQNIMAALQQVKANPAGMLAQAGYNVPASLNNPVQILGHLLQTGQLSQSRLHRCRK